MSKPIDFVVIGSGMAGLSAAIHLAARGKSVTVVEQDTLGSGGSGRAAGLIGQMRSTPDATRLVMASLAFIQQVESELGLNFLRQTGSVRIAQSPERVAELQHDIATAQQSGLPVESIDRKWLAAHMPFMKNDDVLDAAFCPTDVYLEVPELIDAYIQFGQKHHVVFRERFRVEEIILSNGRVTGVRAGGTTIDTNAVINAAGPWSHLIAGLTDQILPAAGIVHRYFTTLPESGFHVDAEAPALRDRELRLYTRPKDGGLRVGIYESIAEGFDMGSAPPGYSMKTMTTDRDHPSVAALFDAAATRFPGITRETPASIDVGVMAFTPDGAALFGSMPEVEGLYHATGLCGHGVAQSGEVGAILADLILDGRCGYKLDELRADRFAEFPNLTTRNGIEAACAANYSGYYSR